MIYRVSPLGTLCEGCLGSPEWRSFQEKLGISQCLNVGQNTYFKHSGRTMPIHLGN